MGKRTGNPNGAKAPWKAKRQDERRKVAEERQAKYNALTFEEKLKKAGTKERAKLLKRAENER
jgi:hypothetical protein